jgi:hypothetical protein
MNQNTFIILLELVDQLTESELRQLKIRVEIRSQELNEDDNLHSILKEVKGGHR